MLTTTATTRTALLLPRTTSRAYAISVQPATVFPTRSVPRVYPEEKSVLYHRYTRLLQSSSTSTLIFLLHADFTPQRLAKLRRDITVASGHVFPSLAPIPSERQPTLTILRTGIFGAALRDYTRLQGQQIADMVKGGLAVLSLPDLDPPQLNAILRAIERSVPPKKPKTQSDLEKEKKEKNADPATPGRRVKRVRPTLEPELRVVGALAETRLFTVDGLRDVSKLPTLDTLRAQIVGLLHSPARQLAAVLGQASGGRLMRTLEGLQRSMDDDRV